MKVFCELSDQLNYLIRCTLKDSFTFCDALSISYNCKLIVQQIDCFDLHHVHVAVAADFNLPATKPFVFDCSPL